MDLRKQEFKQEFAGQELVMEVSRLAEQATLAVIGTYGDTSVLVTVVMGKEDRDVPYFPLNVEYEERFYAAGKILGSRFMRREGRPSEEAILSGRLIDRTIRPLFNHKMRRPVQVVITVLSVDDVLDLDFIALLTASTALAASEIPWNGPVAGVKILKNKHADAYVINPKTAEVSEEFELLAFIAGTEEKINMIELEGVEALESHTVEAFEKAQKEIADLIVWQKGVIAKIGHEKSEVPLSEIDPELKKSVEIFLSDRIEKALYVHDKKEQEENIRTLRHELREFLKEAGAEKDAIEGADDVFEAEVDALVHKNVLASDKRPDGRALHQVRDLYGEIGLFKRTHGSGFFIRGNTQSLAVTTLGAPGDQQLVDGIQFSGKKRFILHYNFPPYSVGETGFFRGPGRREIGHGALAIKGIKNMIPSASEFPYTIRVVSEILSSNGSSSMATICATTLSLMDAGVPLKKMVAGIAMGLISDGKGTDKVLTDIQGPEDHYGDMDLKVAGTRDGITAVQMDVKIHGVTPKVLRVALEDAKRARETILTTLEAVIKEPKKELSPYAPSILTINIPPEKIGEVIGPGGKVINGIIERTGALSIDIEDDGIVFITADDQAKGKAALEEVKAIVKVYEVGEIVEGTIVKVIEVGAIVEIGPGRDGMIHVSELKEGFVKNVGDVVKEGDFVRAKIIRVDPASGKIGLSLKGITPKE